MIDRRPKDILVFFFSLQKQSDRSCLFLTSSSLQLLEHHAEWFEVLLELPNNFDAPTDYSGQNDTFLFFGGRPSEFAKPQSTKLAKIEGRVYHA
jgi:hypothetical protein